MGKIKIDKETETLNQDLVGLLRCALSRTGDLEHVQDKRNGHLYELVRSHRLGELGGSCKPNDYRAVIFGELDETLENYHVVDLDSCVSVNVPIGKAINYTLLEGYQLSERQAKNAEVVRLNPHDRPKIREISKAYASKIKSGK